ncbi:MAG TPA: endo alpha-1,4 polygalactosaminidase [Polyangiales bacterium]|nr:endo alpha-1,4 polygalactosaminidase [Polyangiales bacterium]
MTGAGRWIAALALCACSAEGQLLFRKAGPELGVSDASTPPIGGVVRSDMSLQYQITGEIDPQVDAELYVVDLFDTNADEVTQLHAAGRVVVGYVSVGTLESWRSDESQFPRAAVGRTVPNYSNESWLDVRNADVRRLMQARFARAATKGFDGVFASTLGAYRQNSGFDLTRADELDYHAFLTDAAHAAGLVIGLSGDFELSAELANLYDFAIATSCIMRDTCGDLAPLQARGMPVFDLESSTDHAMICERAKSFGIAVTFKDERYGAASTTCP